MQIRIAVSNGDSVIFKLLLDYYSSISQLPAGLLANILEYFDQTIARDSKGCYKALIEKLKKEEDRDLVALKVNEPKGYGYTATTPLHYAIR